MHLAYAANAVLSSTPIEESEATIKADAHMLRILSQGLYTNKPRALIREISCNASDAHRMIGRPDLPIRVHLPSSADPRFWIQDFGPGMSHDFVMRNYQTYGHSDKRSAIITPDMTEEQKLAAIKYAETANGGFGLGSKAPYAYGDQFAVEVVQDGKLRRYACFIDPAGKFKTNLLETIDAPADWLHGVRITVPVKEDDINTFIDEATWVYRWFRTAPEFVGHAKLRLPEPLIDLPRIRFFSSDDHTNYLLVLHMGDCAYPVFEHQLSAAFKNSLPDHAANLLRLRAAIDVPMGTFDIAPSRESPDYTPRTYKALHQLLVEADRTTHTDFLAKYTPDIDAVTLAQINDLRERSRLSGFTYWHGHYEFEAVADPDKRDLLRAAMSGMLQLDDDEIDEFADILHYRMTSNRTGDFPIATSFKKFTDHSIDINKHLANLAFVRGNPKFVDSRLRDAIRRHDFDSIVYFAPKLPPTVPGQTGKQRAQAVQATLTAYNARVEELARKYFNVPIIEAASLSTAFDTGVVRVKRPKLLKPKIPCKRFIFSPGSCDFTDDQTYYSEFPNAEYLAYASVRVFRKQRTRGFSIKLAKDQRWINFADCLGALGALASVIPADTPPLEILVFPEEVAVDRGLVAKHNLKEPYQIIHDLYDGYVRPFCDLVMPDSSEYDLLQGLQRDYGLMTTAVHRGPYTGEEWVAHCLNQSSFWIDLCTHAGPKLRHILLRVEAAAAEVRKLNGTKPPAPPATLGNGWLQRASWYFAPITGPTQPWNLTPTMPASKAAPARAAISSLTLPSIHRLHSLAEMGLYKPADPAFTATILERII